MNNRTSSLILPSRNNNPKRVYVFVVTALAVFLVGLALWRIPVAGYTSQVIIGYDTGHSEKGQELSSSPLVFIVNEIVQPERLFAAAQIAGVVDSQETIQETWPVLETLATRIEITVVPHVKCGEYLVNVKAFDADQDVALHLVDQLTRSFVADYQARVVSQSNEIATQGRLHLRRAGASVSGDGKEELSAAKQDPKGFLDQYLTSEGHAKYSSPVQRQVNPRWNEHREWLARLEVTHVDLLVDKTSAHPEVVEIDRKISMVQKLLQSTERHVDVPTMEKLEAVEGETRVVSKGFSTDKFNVSVLFSQGQGQRVGLLGKYKSLKDNSVAAQNKHDATLASSIATYSAAVTHHKTPRIWIEQCARVAQHHGGSLSFQRLVSLLATSLFFALLVSLFATVPVVHDKLTSVKDVRQHLQLPIFATLTTRDGPDSTSEYSTRRFVRLTRMFGEAVLVASIALIAVRLYTDSSFSGFLWQNPFAAYSDSIGRVFN